MKKNILNFYLKIFIGSYFIFLFFGCFENRTNDNNNPVNIIQDDQNIDLLSTYDCSASDFFQLKNKNLQYLFFNQLDSILKIQYPNGDLNHEIIGELNPTFLNQFLNDLPKDSLLNNNNFEKKYHFNIAPPEFTDSEKCYDKILIEFDETDCYFSMSIFFSFLFETEFCTESMTVYYFQIYKNRIINFGRQMAG